MDDFNVDNVSTVFESSPSTQEWFDLQDTTDWKATFDDLGYLKIQDILSEKEVAVYRKIYDKFLCGAIDASTHRHDLGSHVAKKVEDSENICQIMWPSKFMESLVDGPFHQRAILCSKIIFGEDMEFDFDMMISKAPFTNTVVPWHQDESYWLNLPDKRAISFWLSLDHATVQNGCMQFIDGSHKKPLREHRAVEEGHHALTCFASEEEFTTVPLLPGSCTLHQGRTVHYTRGNETSSKRRALIVNTRPLAMVEMERKLGFDHGRSKGIEDIAGEGQGHETRK